MSRIGMFEVFARDLFPGYETRVLEYDHPDPAFLSMNPSIHRDSTGQWWCMFRCINYRLGKAVPKIVHTRCVLAELDIDNDFAIKRAHELADVAERERTDFPIHGYEDARLFRWRDRLWASATACDFTPNGNREICLLELEPDDHQIVRAVPLRGAWTPFYQKNWVPRIDRDNLSFVYSVDRSLVIGMNAHCQPGIVCLERGLVKEQHSIHWGRTTDLRGSSQAMRIGESWLILVHDRYYRSRFVLCNDLMHISHATPEFHFREAGIEFCAGAVLDLVRKDQRIVASFSVKDATCEVGIFPLESVMSQMKGWTTR